MDLKDFARALRAAPERLRQNLADAERATADEAKRLAVRYSSGTKTAADLARAGHPYSRRAPGGAYDPAIINARTGLFRASWQEPRQSVTGSGIVTVVANTSPEAAYMGGTSRMLPRPIADAVLEDVADLRERNLRAAVEKTFSEF